MGGENFTRPSCEPVTGGSSPRGRGKHDGHHAQIRPPRLIPAWAGKTVADRGPARRGQAHPRVGGENGQLDDTKHTLTGSSPRGRGKRRPIRRVLGLEGLIPAWAGKTNERRVLPRASPAHPRVGGENDPSTTLDPTSPGSSPRGRGKHQPRRARHPRDGLIPAWAGKTVRPRRRQFRRPAHPRVGGENAVSGPTGQRCYGSSPRGRGKPSVLGPFC